MTFLKKTWTDRISEYITRRLLTKSDGSTEQVTVTRDEGEITQEGTPLNAATFNDLESRISDAFSSTDTSISDINTHLTENDTNLTKLNNKTRRTRKNITSSLGNLAKAAAEQDLEKYGYSIGDYFTGASGYTYHLADMDPYYGG